MRLWTVIPDARIPRLSLSVIPEGAMGIHVRGGGVAVGDTVTSADTEGDIEGEDVIEGVREGVREGVSEED